MKLTVEEYVHIYFILVDSKTLKQKSKGIVADHGLIFKCRLLISLRNINGI